MLTKVHGALLEIRGLGVLLLGASGIGKSECALDLVARGHRLIADDVVEVDRAADGRLLGRAPELIRHYIEIRGIGLLYVPELFGPESVRDQGPIELVCHLERWREEADYERIGLSRASEPIAGEAVPALVLPVRTAGNMALLVEVAARDALQRRAGSNAAARLDARLRGLSEQP